MTHVHMQLAMHGTDHSVMTHGHMQLAMHGTDHSVRAHGHMWLAMHGIDHSVRVIFLYLRFVFAYSARRSTCIDDRSIGSFYVP
jgi:hypothetical protein